MLDAGKTMSIFLNFLHNVVLLYFTAGKKYRFMSDLQWFKDDGQLKFVFSISEQ